MAHKPKSFKLDEKKKAIIIYTNSEYLEEEAYIREYYLKNGYMPLSEVKKETIKVADMRKELAKDPETLAKFNEAYKDKEIVDGKIGYHRAMKIYSDWKKENKAKK